MTFIGEVIQWFLNGSHWQGDGGIPHRTLEHIELSAVSMLAAMAIALPVGIVIGHFGRGGTLAINISNVGRALPSFALLVIAFELFGLGAFNGAIPPFVALVALGIPPIVTNSYLGMREVDADIREAAKGMGMRARLVLWRVELPIALPFIMAGIRIATVTTIGLVTVTALIGEGGLGSLIYDGLLRDFKTPLLIGSVLSVALALVADLSLSGLQRVITPWSRGRATT